MAKCDGCTDHGDFFHRCRANEDDCVDGKDCPDFIAHCDCWCQKTLIKVQQE